jgi:hypothetical protein
MGNMLDLRKWVRQTARKIFRDRRVHFDERLAGMEHVFHAPPLTLELVRAIRLISPHLILKTNEQDRLAWENDQNEACWIEYESLAPLLGALPQPRRVLEIGPGLGRSIVFFSKKLGWESTDIHLYEGDGNRTKYTTLGPRFEDSFCGNMKMLRRVLDYNGVQNVTIVDAKQFKLSDLPGPYDLLYSFYSIGFHWSLEFFLDDLLPLMHKESVAIFSVPKEFSIYPRLEQLSYQVIDWKVVDPGDCGLKFVVLSKRA